MIGGKQQQQKKIAEKNVFCKKIVNRLAGAPVGQSESGLDHHDPDVLVIILTPNLSSVSKILVRLNVRAQNKTESFRVTNIQRTFKYK